MPSFWETAKVFLVVVALLVALAGLVVSAVMDPSWLGYSLLAGLAIAVLWVVWPLCGWIAFVIRSDW